MRPVRPSDRLQGRRVQQLLAQAVRVKPGCEEAVHRVVGRVGDSADAAVGGGTDLDHRADPKDPADPVRLPMADSVQSRVVVLHGHGGVSGQRGRVDELAAQRVDVDVDCGTSPRCPPTRRP